MRTSHYPEDRHGTVPLTIIGGAPGAGKSSLVRHLMEKTTDRRVVAIVQDLAPLLESAAKDVRRDGSFVQWPSGCVAIASDDATATLAALSRMATRAEHVVVEADGDINPRRLAGYAYMPGYGSDCMVTVVDACSNGLCGVGTIPDERTVAQLRFADVVVVNKLDVAGRDAASAVQRAIGVLAPTARFLWSRRGRVAPSLLLGPAASYASPEDPFVVAEWSADYLPKGTRGNVPTLSDSCRAWQLLADRPIAVRRFRTWVGKLPQSITRASGFVHVDEDPTHRHEFSLIGSRWQLKRGAPWDDERPSTCVTLVGVNSKPRSSRQTSRESDVGLEGDAVPSWRQVM